MSASQAPQAMTKDQLAGTWQLVSFQSSSGDQIGYPLGERPGGFIGFTASRFWVMLIDGSRKLPAAAAMTDAEAVGQMKSHAAYTGTYDADAGQTPDGIKITIHVDAASNQAIAGTDRVFYVRRDANKLIFRSQAALAPMSGLVSVVRLEFVQAD